MQTNAEVKMQQRRVLVTGGSGFIGRRVVSRFLSEGDDVASFALPGEALPADWEGRVAARSGNLLEPASLAAAFEDRDLVIHLAGLVGHGGDYDLQWRIFVDGTHHVCEAAGGAGSRLVVATSIAVYGTHIQTRVCDEEAGHGPWAGAYGRAKQGQEATALEAASRLSLPLTLIRPANVYGLGGGGAWGDRLIEAIRASGGALIGEADTNNAGLTHVDNLADAIFLAGTHPAAIGRTYNVCDGEDVTWARFMTDMAALAGRPRPPLYPLQDVLDLVNANESPAELAGPENAALPFMEGVNLVGFDNRFPNARIRRELGWTPQIRYPEALEQMRRSIPAAAIPGSGERA
jgi:nucleoside-diphosphate-sugar epimerase